MTRALPFVVLAGATVLVLYAYSSVAQLFVRASGGSKLTVADQCVNEQAGLENPNKMLFINF